MRFFVSPSPIFTTSIYTVVCRIYNVKKIYKQYTESLENFSALYKITQFIEFSNKSEGTIPDTFNAEIISGPECCFIYCTHGS